MVGDMRSGGIRLWASTHQRASESSLYFSESLTTAEKIIVPILRATMQRIPQPDDDHHQRLLRKAKVAAITRPFHVRTGENDYSRPPLSLTKCSMTA